MGFLSTLDIKETLIKVIVFFFSISFHETAHGWVAAKLGDDTATLQGRVTLNPIPHIDPIGLLMMIVGPIGWAKPVPINPMRFKRTITMKKGMVLTALAGPVSNLILAFLANVIFNIILVIGNLTGMFNITSMAGVNAYSMFIQFFSMMIMTNLFLAVFNLLPVPPADGSKILGGFLPSHLYYAMMGKERYIGLAFLAFIFFIPGANHMLSRILIVLVQPVKFLLIDSVDSLFHLLFGIY